MRISPPIFVPKEAPTGPTAKSLGLTELDAALLGLVRSAEGLIISSADGVRVAQKLRGLGLVSLGVGRFAADGVTPMWWMCTATPAGRAVDLARR